MQVPRITTGKAQVMHLFDTTADDAGLLPFGRPETLIAEEGAR